MKVVLRLFIVSNATAHRRRAIDARYETAVPSRRSRAADLLADLAALQIPTYEARAERENEREQG